MNDDGMLFGNFKTFKLEDLVGKNVTIVKLDSPKDGSSIVAACERSTGTIYVLAITVPLIKVPKRSVMKEYMEVMR